MVIRTESTKTKASGATGVLLLNPAAVSCSTSDEGIFDATNAFARFAITYKYGATKQDLLVNFECWSLTKLTLFPLTDEASAAFAAFPDKVGVLVLPLCPQASVRFHSADANGLVLGSDCTLKTSADTTILARGEGQLAFLQ